MLAATGDIAEDPDGSLHVVAVDSGTWPTDGGGVATCRELVLDYVQHVRWSVLSEIGNDFKQASSLAEKVRPNVTYTSAAELVTVLYTSFMACLPFSIWRS